MELLEFGSGANLGIEDVVVVEVEVREDLGGTSSAYNSRSDLVSRLYDIRISVKEVLHALRCSQK